MASDVTNPQPPRLLSLLTVNEPVKRCLFAHLRSLDLYSLSLTCRSFNNLLHASTGHWRYMDLSDVRYTVLPPRNTDMIPLPLRKQIPGFHIEIRNLHGFIKRRVEVSRLTALVLDGSNVTRSQLSVVLKECKASLRHLSIRWCMGITLAGVNALVKGLEGGGIRSFWMFGISTIKSFFLVESAEDLQQTLSIFAAAGISTDVYLCPSCQSDGYTSVALCDDDEAACENCNLVLRHPISCLLCFRKGSCESCHKFYCEDCRTMPGSDTISEAVCTNNNYSKNHPWYSLPHRLCGDCISRYGRCRKSNCQRLFCPLVDFATSIRSSSATTDTSPQYAHKKSIEEAKSERYFERNGVVSCDVCGRKCCKSCWNEEKYCRVCTTPGKTSQFKSRAGSGIGRKVFCNGCNTFGHACVCQGYTCYKCVDERLEEEGTGWSWFRCQNCKWDDDRSDAMGLEAVSVPAIFGNVGW